MEPQLNAREYPQGSAKRPSSGSESRRPTRSQFRWTAAKSEPPGAAFTCGCAIAAVLGATRPAQAFPPYASTDADTAAPGQVELQVGVAQIDRDAGASQLLTPLVRANLGVVRRVELTTEVDYAPRERIFTDGAVGGKWATPLTDKVSIGVEAVALVPVDRSNRGVGAQTQLLASIGGPRRVLHLNGGGFHDPRGGANATGWRASALFEATRGDYRLGAELSGSDSDRTRPDLRAGVGVIRAFRRFDVRSALHVGLTTAAPDLTISLWLSTNFHPWR